MWLLSVLLDKGEEGWNTYHLSEQPYRLEFRFSFRKAGDHPLQRVVEVLKYWDVAAFTIILSIPKVIYTVWVK